MFMAEVAFAETPLKATDLGLAAGLWLGFVGVLFIARRQIPGPIRLGRPLPDGTRKAYRLNGLPVLILVTIVIAIGQATGLFTLSTVNRLFWPLFVVANIWAVIHTVFLYWVSRRVADRRSNLLANVWMGVELNPEFWGVDLKMFGYLPSLIGLWVLNLSFAVQQWETLGHLTLRMALYQAFFTVYIFNYFQFEYGMLHTWDVIAEKFGFMLVWGDYVLVPFFYCLCGWYLVGNLDPMSVREAVILTLLFGLGFWLFRGSNGQKHRFKENPSATIWGRPAVAIGGKLLASGFWGIGRKLNYTGELIIYVTFALTTGLRSIVPFILPLWLALLFLHRASRDDKHCREKYGPLWTEYCSRARFRMIPFIY